jgi:hypothetical protein
MSNGCAAASIGSLPNACTASVWKSAPHALAASASAGTSCTTPISLLIHITEHIATSPPSAAAKASARTVPVASTSTSRSSPPSRAT